MPHKDREKPLRIGFLFNHDELHQIAHSAPIIPHLQELAPHWQIDILTSSFAQEQAVKKHISAEQAQSIFNLKKNKAAHILQKISGGFIPLARIGDLFANRKQLSHYNALIVPETTTTFLKTHMKLDKTKLIHIPHGAGDRSIAVSPAIRHFDYVLLPGDKTRNRMIEEAVVREDNSIVVGYPKFDAMAEQEPKKFFDNDKPVVLYNPHFDPKLSSWFKFGEEILEYFANQDQFNFICAPHVMLFKRKIVASVEHNILKFRRDIDERYNRMPHMHIDIGSTNSVDMSYTRSADIYVGDVSSQIYEFIQQPRPTIFINSHDAQWRDNPSYEFWKFGDVVDSIDGFDAALNKSLPMNSDYQAIQKDAFQHTFGMDPKTPSSRRAAQAIINYLNNAKDE